MHKGRHEDNIEDAVEEMAKPFGGTVKIMIPDQERPTVTAGNALGFVFFALLLIVVLIGGNC
jgi:hypothetical protein